MSGPFTKLHHLCIVVHDIERSIGFYESAGIGPWHDYPPLGEFTDLDMPDPDGFRGLRQIEQRAVEVEEERPVTLKGRK